MPRVLFWNVPRKPLDGLVVALAAEHRPDLLVLIEPPAGPGMASALAAAGYAPAGGDRSRVFARPGVALAREPYPIRRARAEFWRVTTGGPDDWPAVIVHGPDRRNARQDATRGRSFRIIAEYVRFLEQAHGHRRTVVFGDFNADPHDPSVVGADGFHALGVRRVRGETGRRVRASERADFLYNPMWRMYGRDPTGDAAAATYFYAGGDEAAEPFWHMSDQVLIRPELADRLPPDQLRILTASGPTRLVDAAGRPNRASASDHLPVYFVLTDA